jgi:hydrogenase maturation protease
MTRVLVAGVGNIFLTDDGFGPEVIRNLTGRQFPPGWHVKDFGIGALHLAYTLLDGYDVLVIVDAAPRGLTPGTVSLIEVDPCAQVEEVPVLDGHSLSPTAILGSLGSLGGRVQRALVLACEPADVSEGLGLSEVMARAVPVALAALADLVVAVGQQELGQQELGQQELEQQIVEEVSR